MSIKLICFDLDGVLIGLPEAHFLSLNQAIEEIAGKQYLISREEHLSTYNGLSTKTKLNKLVKDKNLPPELISQINEIKQKYTIQAIKENFNENYQLQEDLNKLKLDGYLLYCASNAIRATIEASLIQLGIFKYFDHIISNEDVKRQKPSPDIYLQCFLHAGVDPKETVIIEDSAHGRTAAIKSGAHVCTVDNPDDTTYEYIKNYLNHLEEINRKINFFSTSAIWIDNKLNVVLPMSGAGSRFKIAGFELPKPLINVHDRPMIEMVVKNINVKANIIFIVQRLHYEQYNLQYLLPLIAPDCKIVIIEQLTEGAACSVLHAEQYINNNQHLFIINSDQYLEWDSFDFFNKMLTSQADGGIITFKKNNDRKWSYVRLNDEGYVIEVKEKEPISDTATIGGYFWRKSSDFVSSAKEMIAANDRTNNEFYLAPTYNYLISKGKKIITYDIPEDKFWGTGVPSDLDYFLQNYKK